MAVGKHRAERRVDDAAGPGDGGGGRRGRGRVVPRPPRRWLARVDGGDVVTDRRRRSDGQRVHTDEGGERDERDDDDEHDDHRAGHADDVSR